MGTVPEVHDYLNDLIERCAAQVESRQAMLDLVREVVVEQARFQPQDRLPFLFGQFVVATAAISEALEAGDLSACGDWIGWSLSPTIDLGHEVTMEIQRLRVFWSSDVLAAWPGFGPTLITYFDAFYYYARLRSAMRHEAIGMWPVAIQVVSAVMARAPRHIQASDVALGCSMLAWAAIQARPWARRLTARVETWVDDPALSAETRAACCVTLATRAGRFSNQPQVHWAHKALHEFGAHLVGTHRVLMLTTVFDPDSEQHIDAILAAMDEHQGPLRQALSPMAFMIEAGNKADITLAFVSRCMNAGRADVAVRGIARWYQGPTGNEAVDPESVLLTSPFSELGYIAACHRWSQQLERDSQALLVRQTQEANAFLGAALTVAHADNSNLRLPERPGVPAMAGGQEWFATLAEIYCPASPLQDAAPSSQLTLLAMAHPVQAIQQASWGVTWPITASLSAPAADRPPHTVALWSGGGSMTEAMEVDMVRAAFEAAGGTVEVFDPANGNREAFLAAYQDPRFDVFWVASHGEFDHWSPRHVQLQVAADRTTVTLEDLLGRAPAHEGRRLLVLNVCDGARFDETGMVPRIGLAPGLATSRQATISHLWPVEGFPSAAFGAYLACFLAAGTPFFEAYVQALVALRNTGSSIADGLQALFGGNFELLDRLRARNEDYRPLKFSGSPAFFQ